ncbi:MAG: hypothetical protein C0392_06780 [Syntrophus sp. (in: bacteria)]|nr:hypothetical protein [Syntrophus sp. (in: bacteria)]
MKKKQNESKVNPHLKEAFLEVVENQIRDNDPPETRETLERLMGEGISEKDARIYVARVVAIEVYEVMKNEKPFDLQRFVRNLNALPNEPRE